MKPWQQPRRAVVALATLALSATMLATTSAGSTAVSNTPAPRPGKDVNIPRVCDNQRPPAVDPDSYGMRRNGTFKHPKLTYVNEEEKHPFKGGGADLFPQQDGYDPGRYRSKNINIAAHYAGSKFTPDPFHTWQNIVDFKGRRYLFVYDRSDARVFDVTNVRKVKLVESLSRSDVPWDFKGNPESQKSDDWAPYDYWGASTIQWSETYDAYVMVQSFEQKRQIPFWLGDAPGHYKFNNASGVKDARKDLSHKGFKVYRLDGPRKKDWKLLATVSTDETQADPLNPDMTKPQQGSGSLDVPYWTGGRYMFVATAPSDDWSMTEYPTYLYSAGIQTWDMADPAHPLLLDTWHREGQVRGEEAAYAENPRCGNRTSWMGARMPLFVPTPIEEGGTVAFAALGGFGVSVIDISDPANLRETGHVDLPMSVAGTEGDNVDVSQYEKTGMVYVSGYPLSEDCYEPYKDVYRINARDPENPRIVGKLPRPTPPKQARITDYCQRGGSFGPKRTGYYTSPGDPDQGTLIYDFYNAGAQFFDVSKPGKPKIKGYFVPPTFGKQTPDYARGNVTHGVYVEWDRKVVWLLSNDGIYALTSKKILGRPNLKKPRTPFRNSAR